MNELKQKFQDEIEVERLWVTTDQGKYGFYSMLPVTILLIYGLWDTSPHTLLIFWFFLDRAANLFRWWGLQYYHENKNALIADIPKFKHFVLISAALFGLCWGLFVIWFIIPSEPLNVIIICVTLVIEVIGAILFWFWYLPALIAITLPPSIPLLWSLILQGDQIYLATSAIIFVGLILGFLSSFKLTDTLNYALRLNFENAALRKETEEKSILLETVLENMDQGISLSDKDDHLRMWNKQFIKLLGEASSLVVKDAELAPILDAANPSIHQYSPVADKLSHQKFSADNPHLYFRSKMWTRFRLLNGQVYEIRQSELNQGGRILTYTDITDQVKHEEVLEKARKEAEQANAAKTRFLAAASHDLRQPIHALGLFFADLSDRVKSPETEQVIGQVEDSITAINSMLNALLDVSKLDAGVVKPDIDACELSDLFMRLDAEFQPIAHENNNELRIRPSTAWVETDPAMLERMLRNLIGNAIRYTENGRILVGIRQRKQHIEIQVIDNGIGIPKDQLKDIFIEFHQLNNPARDRRRGLGLGLAIVKRLANLLHHDIKVVSHFGRGSCFSITLPLARKTATSEPITPIVTANKTNFSLIGRQILVLDDDISVLEGMQGLLSHWGCQVICAGSPAEAVDKVSASMQKPEVLIIDYRLTDNFSGIDVAINLQKRLGYLIPVLIITGDTAPERLKEADASGFPLLHKPVQPAKLRSTLQYLVSKANSTTSDSPMPPDQS